MRLNLAPRAVLLPIVSSSLLNQHDTSTMGNIGVGDARNTCLLMKFGFGWLLWLRHAEQAPEQHALNAHYLHCAHASLVRPSCTASLL
jgi:hypothetical protein